MWPDLPHLQLLSDPQSKQDTEGSAGSALHSIITTRSGSLVCTATVGHRAEALTLLSYTSSALLP